MSGLIAALDAKPREAKDRRSHQVNPSSHHAAAMQPAAVTAAAA